MVLPKQFHICFLTFCVFSFINTHASLLGGLLNPPPITIPQLCNPRSSPPSANSLPHCVLSVEDITSGRPLQGTKLQPSPMPYWFNATLARIGQTFALKNKFSITVGALSGLLAGLPIPDATDVLTFTSNSDTADKSAHRYLATATQLYIWLDEILNMQLNDIFFTSVANVRAIHLDVVNRINSITTVPLNDPNKYSNVTTDEVMWTAIANDLNSSQITIHPTTVLIHDATNEELTGWIHLWAILGYVIGVDDNYNIMLQSDVATARQYFIDINAKYFIPCYFNVDKAGKVLVESMLKAVNQYLPTMGTRPIMHRLLRDYFKIPAPAMLALINSQVSDNAAEFTWETVIAPSTALADERLVLNTGVSTDVQALIILYFGSYLTNEDKADHVYYPRLPT